MASIGERLRHFHPVRKLVYFFVGLFSYPGLAIINTLKITGTEHLKGLPPQKYFSLAITKLILRM